MLNEINNKKTKSENKVNKESITAKEEVFNKDLFQVMYHGSDWIRVYLSKQMCKEKFISVYEKWLQEGVDIVKGFFKSTLKNSNFPKDDETAAGGEKLKKKIML